MPVLPEACHICWAFWSHSRASRGTYRWLQITSPVQLNSQRPECIYSFVQRKKRPAHNMALMTPLCPSAFCPHIIKTMIKVDTHSNLAVADCPSPNLPSGLLASTVVEDDISYLLCPLQSWREGIDDFSLSTSHIIFPWRAPCFEVLLAGRHFAKKNVEWKALKAGYRWIINVSDLGEQ